MSLSTHPRLRISLLSLLAVVSSLALAGCSKRSNALDISPPLPPAEEPRDDVPGAYVGDAGAVQP